MNKIQVNDALGHTFTDKITGFTGVATGHCRYLTGCTQVLLAPKASPDGTFKESNWFDEQRLVLNEDVAQVELNNGETPGACEAAPKR